MEQTLYTYRKPLFWSAAITTTALVTYWKRDLLLNPETNIRGVFLATVTNALVLSFFHKLIKENCPPEITSPPAIEARDPSLEKPPPPPAPPPTPVDLAYAEAISYRIDAAFILEKSEERLAELKLEKEKGKEEQEAECKVLEATANATQEELTAAKGVLTTLQADLQKQQDEIRKEEINLQAERKLLGTLEEGIKILNDKHQELSQELPTLQGKLQEAEIKLTQLQRNLIAAQKDQEDCNEAATEATIALQTQQKEKERLDRSVASLEEKIITLSEKLTATSSEKDKADRAVTDTHQAHKGSVSERERCERTQQADLFREEQTNVRSLEAAATTLEGRRDNRQREFDMQAAACHANADQIRQKETILSLSRTEQIQLETNRGIFEAEWDKIEAEQHSLMDERGRLQEDALSSGEAEQKKTALDRLRKKSQELFETYRKAQPEPLPDGFYERVIATITIDTFPAKDRDLIDIIDDRGFLSKRLWFDPESIQREKALSPILRLQLYYLRIETVKKSLEKGTNQKDYEKSLAIQARLSELSHTKESTESALNVLTEKIKALKEAKEKVTKDLGWLKEEESPLQSDYATAQEELEPCKKNAKSAREDFQKADRELKARGRTVDEQQAALTATKASEVVAKSALDTALARLKEATEKLDLDSATITRLKKQRDSEAVLAQKAEDNIPILAEKAGEADYKLQESSTEVQRLREAVLNQDEKNKKSSAKITAKKGTRQNDSLQRANELREKRVGSMRKGGDIRTSERKLVHLKGQEDGLTRQVGDQQGIVGKLQGRFDKQSKRATELRGALDLATEEVKLAFPEQEKAVKAHTRVWETQHTASLGAITDHLRQILKEKEKELHLQEYQLIEDEIKLFEDERCLLKNLFPYLRDDAKSLTLEFEEARRMWLKRKIAYFEKKQGHLEQKCNAHLSDSEAKDYQKEWQIAELEKECLKEALERHNQYICPAEGEPPAAIKKALEGSLEREAALRVMKILVRNRGYSPRSEPLGRRESGYKEQWDHSLAPIGAKKDITDIEITIAYLKIMIQRHLFDPSYEILQELIDLSNQENPTQFIGVSSSDGASSSASKDSPWYFRIFQKEAASSSEDSADGEVTRSNPRLHDLAEQAFIDQTNKEVTAPYHQIIGALYPFLRRHSEDYADAEYPPLLAQFRLLQEMDKKPSENHLEEKKKDILTNREAIIEVKLEQLKEEKRALEGYPEIAEENTRRANEDAAIAAQQQARRAHNQARDDALNVLKPKLPTSEYQKAVAGEAYDGRSLRKRVLHESFHCLPIVGLFAAYYIGFIGSLFRPFGGKLSWPSAWKICALTSLVHAQTSYLTDEKV